MAKKKIPISTEIKSYTTLERAAVAEMTERKSVFIGCAAPVKTADEAIGFIAKVRSEHSGASHVVYAYLLNDENIMRYSDDGEPQGTAGIPVLDVIRKNGFSDAVIAVARYFGGVLLGAGGLVRAYTAAAVLAVKKAHVISYEEYTVFKMRCNYADYQKIEYEMPKYGVKCDNTDFGEYVTLDLAICSAVFDNFSARISELTSGRLSLEIDGKRFDKQHKHNKQTENR